ncbi:DUF4350 domain-containing protein [Actinospongicola halichondriae]|uniref:DUF4350 domain-containing protein n=1 Tax=Actinospongicola halichondriae TaxID=3236844 RepID=UPI003D39324F
MNRRWIWIGVIAVVVLGGAYFGSSRQNPGAPLDPASTSPDGAKAVVELVGRLGGSIEVVEGVPASDVDVALVLEDRFPRDQADDIEGWVRRGGTLVVADPSSLFSPRVGAGVIDVVSGRCAVEGLEDVATIDVGVSRRYQTPDESETCFASPSGEAFLVSEASGEGRIVSLGGPSVFTNDLLDEDDNAVLAGALLSGEGRRAAFVRPVLAGSGDQGLVDLIGTPVRAALAQLLVVFLVVVLWRARRLGRPVTEPQPVQIQGSELTNAVGRLLQNNRRPDRAAAILRDHARRDLSSLLGLPLDAPVDVVESTIAARTSLDDVEVRRATSDPVTSDELLVEVAHLLNRIREELTHDRSAIR